MITTRLKIQTHLFTRSLLTGIFISLKFSLFTQPVDNSFSIHSSQEHKPVTISNLADWEHQRWQIQKGLESAMGPLPDRFTLPELDIIIVDTLETDRYFRFNLTFSATQDEYVPAYLYIPKRKGLNGKLPAMVALHPTGMAGKKIVDGEGLANRGYARELAERGYIVIAPDYPGYGDLENYDFKASRYQSGTMAAIFYHMRCVDLLCDRPDVDKDKIGVIGHSLGGHNAMFLGAFDPRLKVIVTSCGWTQLEDYDIGPGATETYGGRLGPWAQERYMPLIREVFHLDEKIIPFNFHEIIALLAPRAFFSNSPVNDDNFEVTGVMKGIREAGKVYEFLASEKYIQVRYPEAGHDFPIEIRLESYQFIDMLFDHIPSKQILE